MNGLGMHGVGRVARGITLSLAAMLLAVGGVAGSASASAATAAVPYHDSNAVGVIGLCDQAGQQITHGSINTTPFAWRAVSSVAAAAPYNTAAATATLYAYQPIDGLDPGDWSGAQLTASARFSNPAHPMAAATAGDESLANFIGEFAPKWDGLLELRIFLSAPNQEVESQTYPALDIKVTGTTWTAVDGAPVDCGSGRAVSIESVVLPHADTHPRATASAPSSTTAPSTVPPAASSSSAAPAVSASAATPSLAAASSPASSAGGHGTAIVVALVAVLALLSSGYFAYRRRGDQS